MEIYLVGGAVRDILLGLPVKDRDWVVVGARPQELVDQGFIAVGKDFPVFLHPRSKEEYALARTERSTAPGYKGFAFYAAPDVTLEQDLARRDLTINAIAVAQSQLDASGNFDPAQVQLYDPFNGHTDLQQHRLRHVSEAFHEDPVRILRVARFAARFTSFQVAEETMALMRHMVARGEVHALVAERVWQELARGLMEQRPARMLGMLIDSQALPELLPELQAAKESGSDSNFLRWMRVLDRSARVRAGLAVRFACLCMPLTQAAHLDALCTRLRAPNACGDLARLVLGVRGSIDCSDSLDAPAVVKLLERCDAFRKPDRFAALLQACEIQALEDSAQQDYPPGLRLSAALSAAQSVVTDTIARGAIGKGLRGPQIGEAIHAARVQAVADLLQP